MAKLLLCRLQADPEPVLGPFWPGRRSDARADSRRIAKDPRRILDGSSAAVAARRRRPSGEAVEGLPPTQGRSNGGEERRMLLLRRSEVAGRAGRIWLTEDADVGSEPQHQQRRRRPERAQDRQKGSGVPVLGRRRLGVARERRSDGHTSIARKVLDEMPDLARPAAAVLR